VITAEMARIVAGLGSIARLLLGRGGARIVAGLGCRTPRPG
jgi:hypothetical protein